MANVCCRFFITAFSVSCFFNVVFAKESSVRAVRELQIPVLDPLQDDNDGGRPQNWVDPPYWAKYEPILTSKYLKTCADLTAVPTDGSVCTTKATAGWKTCLFGEQTCQATITGVMPGMGSITCDNNLGMIHPTTKCDCNGATWKCYDWKVCLGDAKQVKDFNKTRFTTLPKLYGAMNQTNPPPFTFNKLGNDDGKNRSKLDLPFNFTKPDIDSTKSSFQATDPLSILDRFLTSLLSDLVKLNGRSNLDQFLPSLIADLLRLYEAG